MRQEHNYGISKYQPLPYEQDVTQGQRFKQSLSGLNIVFLLRDSLSYQC